MSYAVKEIFYTLQGEGAQTGRPAVFCRFAGCNLWSGREQDRSSAVCKFCDTDFADTNGRGGGHFASAEALSAAIERSWPANAEGSNRFVVCTGGEPLLQLDEDLVDALHARSYELPLRRTEPSPLRTASIGFASVQRPARIYGSAEATS